MADDLSYKIYGQGRPVIFLHGFPMSGEIWSDEFIKTVSAEFKVVVIDLPGFGSSPLPSDHFTIEDIGSKLLAWAEALKLEKPVLIGHSLGGYVALAMVKKMPEKIAGLGLFHSTAFSDTEEKKLSRDKVIEFVEKNGVSAFTSNFIPPLFFNKQHSGISKVKEIAACSPAAAVKGYTRAMRDRPDQSETLAAFKGRVLFLTGNHDPGIPVEAILKQAALRAPSEIQILDNQSHMGMVEAPALTSRIVRDFCTNCYI